MKPSSLVSSSGLNHVRVVIRPHLVECSRLCRSGGFSNLHGTYPNTLRLRMPCLAQFQQPLPHAGCVPQQCGNARKPRLRHDAHDRKNDRGYGRQQVRPDVHRSESRRRNRIRSGIPARNTPQTPLFCMLDCLLRLCAGDRPVAIAVPEDSLSAPAL